MLRLFLLFVLTAIAWPLVQAEVFTFAGTGVKGFSGDGGEATLAQLNNVYAVARGPDGWLYFCDMDNHRIRRVSPQGIIETYAGSNERGYEGDGGPANQAKLNQPYEFAWDKSGNLFFVEVGNHCVRRIDAKTRIITTIAGTGKAGFAGDGGPASKAQFNQPHSLAFDTSGHLYVCDILNHRIRKIDFATGSISTWAGTGERKTATDGSPIQGSPLHGPRALVFTHDGKCWLALREGNAVLLLDPQKNTIKRIAGTGKSGFTGNGGPAIEATLSGPKCVSLDANGNVYLADTESHSIRYIDVEKGTLELLVGDGQRGDGRDSGDAANNAPIRLARPHGVFVDGDGSIFIGDSENHRVRVYRRSVNQ
jgi:DNA-binding beta-propeller fold protein YncE